MDKDSGSHFGAPPATSGRCRIASECGCPLPPVLGGPHPNKEVAWVILSDAHPGGEKRDGRRRRVGCDLLRMGSRGAPNYERGP